MDEGEFEAMLGRLCSTLTREARSTPFRESKDFETRVRVLVIEAHAGSETSIEVNPAAQGFPDIAAGRFGIEVKFTANDTWRSVANSVLETNRDLGVTKVYVVFGKMGGRPEVKWGEYEQCVMHVRTSHVPRFEVEVFPVPDESLFSRMGITYDDFRVSPMHQKMQHIREYARGRLKKGERLWWLEDSPDASEHTLPIQARLYTKLTVPEKTKLRAEAVLLSPGIVSSGRSKDKYDDVVMYLLTYHGVLCHQARDLFSAGSVANPNNDDNGGLYIERALKLLEPEMLRAAESMDDALFVEYWGRSVAPKQRIADWLTKADLAAHGWVPSASLFLDYQRARKRRTRKRQE
jgi:hypothetical protein